VFSTVITMRLPANSLNAMANPSGTPIKPAMIVDAQLTFKDTPTMVSISGSKDATSRIAETKLSINRSMVLSVCRFAGLPVCRFAR
jgi:hypothetical protein